MWQENGVEEVRKTRRRSFIKEPHTDNVSKTLKSFSAIAVFMSPMDSIGVSFIAGVDFGDFSSSSRCLRWWLLSNDGGRLNFHPAGHILCSACAHRSDAVEYALRITAIVDDARPHQMPVATETKKLLKCHKATRSHPSPPGHSPRLSKSNAACFSPRFCSLLAHQKLSDIICLLGIGIICNFFNSDCMRRRCAGRVLQCANYLWKPVCPSNGRAHVSLWIKY